MISTKVQWWYSNNHILAVFDQQISHDIHPLKNFSFKKYFSHIKNTLGPIEISVFNEEILFRTIFQFDHINSKYHYHKNSKFYSAAFHLWVRIKPPLKSEISHCIISIIKVRIKMFLVTFPL